MTVCKGQLELSVNYPGNDLNNGHLHKKKTVEECQAFCQADPACVGFIYYTKKGQYFGSCYKKKTLGKRVGYPAAVGHIYGSRDACPKGIS